MKEYRVIRHDGPVEFRIREWAKGLPGFTQERIAIATAAARTQLERGRGLAHEAPHFTSCECVKCGLATRK